jgi:putative inorganic carbon (hco3(-)) transporter
VFVVLLPTSLIPAQYNSFLNRSITITALVVWLVDVIFHRRKIVLTASALWMLIFIAWAAASLLWAPYWSQGMTALQMYGMRFILFMLLFANLIQTKQDLDGLMYTLALSGGLLVIVSMIVVITQDYLPGTRLQVLDVNENELGVSLLVTTPAVLWWATKADARNKTFKKTLAFLFLVFSFGLIALSGSRGSAISLAVTILVFLILKPTRSWGITGLIVLGLAAILVPFIFSTTVSRFVGAPGETILSGREIIWPAGWMLILDQPFFGVGIGSSSFAVIPYLAQFNYFIIDSSVGLPLHNPLMVAWAETGLPGLLLYMGILISAVWSFIRQYFRSRRFGSQYLSPYFALVFATFTGFMFSWIKGGGMETDYSYFLMLALLLIPSGLREELSHE